MDGLARIDGWWNLVQTVSRSMVGRRGAETYMTVGSPADRECPDCGNGVTRNARHCPSCGRFVPRGQSSAVGLTTKTVLLIVLPLLVLAVVGYVWIPLLGTAAHLALWGLALSHYGGGAGRRLVSILLFPISLLWYDRSSDDVEIRPWLFWFGILAILLVTVLNAVWLWLKSRSGL